MQLSPINFRGSEPVIIDRSNRETAREQELSGADVLHVQEQLDNYLKTKHDAQNNVRLSTVLSTLALFLGLACKGRKIIDPVMNALIAGSETIANKAIGLAGKVFKKSEGAISGVQGKISKLSESLRDATTKNISLKGLGNFVDKVIPGKGSTVTGVIDKLNLNNKVSLARTVAATAVAGVLSDGYADKAEGFQDKRAIDKAKQPLLDAGYEVVAAAISQMAQ